MKSSCRGKKPIGGAGVLWDDPSFNRHAQTLCLAALGRGRWERERARLSAVLGASLQGVVGRRVQSSHQSMLAGSSARSFPLPVQKFSGFPKTRNEHEIIISSHF